MSDPAPVPAPAVQPVTAVAAVAEAPVSVEAVAPAVAEVAAPEASAHAVPVVKKLVAAVAEPAPAVPAAEPVISSGGAVQPAAPLAPVEPAAAPQAAVTTPEAPPPAAAAKPAPPEELAATESPAPAVQPAAPAAAPEDTTPAPAPAPAVGSIAAKLRAQLTFDPAALKARYDAERDKRLRPDGNEQYRRFEKNLQHYLTDPYTPRVEREPMDVETDFLVLGAGFGGLLMAAALVDAGVTDFKVVDKAGDFGGTWYWNRYPGAACDIEAYIYMPLLEETGYIPTEKYAKAPELLAHCRRVGEKYGLYDRAVFHTEVTSMTWDEEASRWVVETDRGDKIRARFAASASGPLNMPKLPGVEGIEDFKGHSFHTSRWDYEYTGGDGYGKMYKLGDKRVGFIGTGATAIQSVPHLGEGVQSGETGRLYVFQRTPSSVARRDNSPTDPEWAASLKPGWQAARQENFLRVMGGSQEEDMVRDGWTTFSRWMKEQGLPRSPNLWKEYGELLELADHQNMERIRARCDDVVKDKATADGLKPWYRTFCKRPTFNDEYLDTFNLPNVTLVDTDGKGVQRITEKGIVANGVEYELDCIVFGTGFEVGTSFSRRANYETYGRGGLTMTDKWAQGVRTLHGYHMHDFPNLFIISTLQSGYAANFVHMLGRQAKHVAWIVARCKERGVKTLEATQEAEDAWGDIIIANQRRNVGFQKECTPGYYNLEGQLNDSIVWQRSSSYGLGPLAFCKLMEEWREKGDMDGLGFTYFEKEAEAPAGEVVANGVNGHAAETTVEALNGTVNGVHEPVVEQPVKEEASVVPAVEKPADGLNGAVEPVPAPAVEPVEKIMTATVSEIAPVLNGAVNGHVNGTDATA